MITIGMIKRQVWIADDDEFDNTVKNTQSVLRLNDQYENHLHVEKFREECHVMSVYGKYVLEGEVDAQFSLGDIWKLFQKDLLENNAGSFCRKVINYMKAWNYLQKKHQAFP